MWRLPFPDFRHSATGIITTSLLRTGGSSYVPYADDFGLSDGLESVSSQPRSRANAHRASILLTTYPDGEGAGLVRVGVAATWVRYQSVRHWSDRAPNTVGLASRDSSGVEWRDARGSISPSAVPSASLDCAVVCDSVRGQILSAVSGSMVRVKWRVECRPLAWRCRYPAVSTLDEVSCGFPGRL